MLLDPADWERCETDLPPAPRRCLLLPCLSGMADVQLHQRTYPFTEYQPFPEDWNSETIAPDM